MADWRESAARALSLLDGDPSDEATRTRCMINHVLDEGQGDGYISKDFFNVQQTAGGLPDTLTMDQFLGAITGHIREDLAKSNFDPEASDDDFRTSLMALDSNITRHIRFLNGVVHQAAAGEVHLALWNLILASRSDPNSIYTCYQQYLVNA
jgi:hypothetical protein